MSIWYKISFYLLSMAPMYLIVGVLSWGIPLCWPFPLDSWTFIGWSELCDYKIVIPLICILLGAYCSIFGFVLKCRISGSKFGPVRITKIENVNYDMMSFVSSFFLPLVSFNFQETTRHAWILLILFVLLGIIYIRSDRYFSNPTLLLLGYYTYAVKSVETDHSTKIHHNVMLITRNRLSKDTAYRFIKIDNNTYYAKEYK